MAANRKDVSTANKGVDLQHRHFCFIAAQLKSTKPATPDLRVETNDAFGTWLQVVNTFADECRATNPRFDRSRFLAACGLEG